MCINDYIMRMILILESTFNYLLHTKNPVFLRPLNWLQRLAIYSVTLTLLYGLTLLILNVAKADGGIERERERVFY